MIEETNFEHYKDEIMKMGLLSPAAACQFKKKNIHKTDSCMGFSCNNCDVKVKKWLDEPYEPYKEPVIEIDWSKVPIDTPVYVSDIIKTPSASTGDKCRHLKEFRKEQDRPFVCFNYGKSSFTCCADDGITSWTYCTLARPEDVEKYKKV